jgi:hypothetical protein
VQSATDPSVPLVQRLTQELPQVDIQLAIDDRTCASNPKISHLSNAIQVVQHDGERAGGAAGAID